MPSNNMRLDEITRLTQLNADKSNGRSNVYLNEVVWNDQSLRLEEGIARIQERFRSADDAARGQLLMDMERCETTLIREELNTARIQDPPEMRQARGRTFGRGGPRRLTGGEIAEKELRRFDKTVPRTRAQPQQSIGSEVNLVDSHAFQQSLIFPQSRPTFKAQAQSVVPLTSAHISKTPQDTDVTIVEPWLTEKIQTGHNIRHSRTTERPNRLTPTEDGQVDCSSLNSVSRPTRQIKRPSIYQGELIQPRKRVRKEN
jgi:hypothetical protein